MLTVLLAAGTSAAPVEDADLQRSAGLTPGDLGYGVDVFADDIIMSLLEAVNPPAAADYGLGVAEERTAEMTEEALQVQAQDVDIAAERRQAALNRVDSILTNSSTEIQAEGYDGFEAAMDRQIVALNAVRGVVEDPEFTGGSGSSESQVTSEDTPEQVSDTIQRQTDASERMKANAAERAQDARNKAAEKLPDSGETGN